MKTIKVDREYHRVHLGYPRPPVGGFQTFQEAFQFALNNIRVEPGVDKQKVLKEAIETYQPTRVVPVRECAEL